MQLCGRRLSWMLAALLLLTYGFASAAQPGRAKRFHLAIEKGSLTSALEQFSRQTGLQVITQLNVSESKTEELGPLVRYATTDDALKALLTGTDLSYEWLDKYTITIFTKVLRPPRAENDVQEVLVTGSRLRSVEDGPAPVRVYGDTRIERYGVSSVSDLSRYLTQQPFAFSAGYQHSGAQFFQLRGLGFDTTLVLINGRRVPPSANSISLNAVDINNIPVTAVERVEVMSDSASAIYGADAIGGVVNILLKDKIEKPEVYLHYGQADGGGAQRRAAVSLGTANDRLKSTLVMDYYETAALMGEERDLWSNQDYRRFGGQDYRVSTTNPGNVYSLTGQPLPGLRSSHAAVPFGAPGGKLSPADFFETDGVTNLESDRKDWSITPASHRASAYGSAEYSFSQKYSLFGEILAANAEVITLVPPPSVSRQVVPASNPFNPFGTAVAVDYSFAGMDPISYIYDMDLLRLVGGGRGKMGQWEWEITGLRHAEDVAHTVPGGLDSSRVDAAINSDDPLTALNLFSDGPPGSPELLNSLVGPPARSSFWFSSSQLSAFLRGPVFNLGERTVELVVGGEWRQDAAEFLFSEFGVPAAEADRDVSSLFSEVRVPLTDALLLKIAVRGDDYSDGEHIVSPQYGLTWRPARDWLFRAAYGRSFRPPSLFELYMPRLQFAPPTSDPLRGGEVSNVTLMVGGNRDLEAVTARSFTAGFVFNPSDMPGLRIGGGYWRVAMDNRIMVPNYQELLRPGSPFESRVVRDAPTSQDLEAGWPGRLRSINLIRMNYGDLTTSGIDMDASLEVERSWGSFGLDLAVTWIDEYLSRDMNQVLPLERVGVANVLGTIPEWRAVGTLSWKLGDFGVSTTTTLVCSYRDTDFWTGVLDRRVSSQTQVDLQAWVNLKSEGSAWLDGATLTLGARNVFDEAPDFAIAGMSEGYDFSQGDLTRRFIYLRVGKQF
jgi:iron complex outermembrane recepter protein